MTMAEFNIRLFAYNRLDKKEWLKVFELSKSVIGSSMIDSKGKKSMLNEIKNNYFGVSKPQMTEFQKNVMKKAQLDYINRKNKK